MGTTSRVEYPRQRKLKTKSPPSPSAAEFDLAIPAVGELHTPKACNTHLRSTKGDAHNLRQRKISLRRDSPSYAMQYKASPLIATQNLIWVTIRTADRTATQYVSSRQIIPVCHPATHGRPLLAKCGKRLPSQYPQHVRRPALRGADRRDAVMAEHLKSPASARRSGLHRPPEPGAYPALQKRH